MTFDHRSMGVMAVAGLLSSCATLEATRPSEPPKHLDIAYTQFVLPPDGNNKTPVDLSDLPIVVSECGGKPAEEVKAGGASILLTLATSLVGKLAEALVKDLQQWVNAEVAKYSMSSTGTAVRLPFYSPTLWYQKPPSDDYYSCFAIALAQCDTPAEGVGRCPDPHATRAVIIGQFRRTSEYLQVRPLAAYVRGLLPKRGSGKASLAASLKLSSVWWDGRSGHSETPEDIKVMSGTFVPAGEEDTVNLAVLEKDTKPRVDGQPLAPPAPVSWDKQPLLPLPPQSPHSEGTVEITATVAEANNPPGDLKFLQKVLGDHATELSTALKSALTELLPATPAKK